MFQKGSGSRNRNVGLIPEELESRRLFSAISVTGTSGNDVIEIYKGSSTTVDVKLNGTVIQTVALSGLTSISVDASGGNDTVSVTTSIGVPATLGGGSGNDSLVGDSGNDSFGGGAGNDTLVGGSYADIFDGGADADLVDYSSKTTAVNVTVGDNTANDGTSGEGDTVESNIENVYGGSAGDTLLGYFGTGPVNFFGLGGNDTIFGSPGNDDLEGGAGNDSIDGDAGNDTINGSAGLDTLVGDDGDDLLVGGDDNDVLGDPIALEAGNDTLLGSDGDDTLAGYAGNDSMDGGNGNDGFYVNDHQIDTVIGGAGSDFLFDTPDPGDVITL